MGKTILLLPFAAIGAPAPAQDYDPSMAAHDSMSQQQFRTRRSRIDAMALRTVTDRNGRHRGGRNGATRQQVAACNGKAQLRAEHGADDPKVRRLYALCRSIGR